MTANATAFATLDGQKYLNLETHRKIGTAVRTPVWFAASPPRGQPTETLRLLHCRRRQSEAHPPHPNRQDRPCT
jgi:hypothetical protein